MNDNKFETIDRDIETKVAIKNNNKRKKIIIGILSFISLIIFIIIVSCIIDYINKKEASKPIPQEPLITFTSNLNTYFSYYFTDNNNYFSIVLTNNETSIVNGSLLIYYENTKTTEIINMILPNSKYLIRSKIPDKYQKNYNKTKIKVVAQLNAKVNYSYIDVRKLPLPTITYTNSDIDTTINLKGINSTTNYFNYLNGFVLLSKDNNVIGSANFSIPNVIANESYSYSLKVPGIVNNDKLEPLNYDKVQLFFTSGY